LTPAAARLAPTPVSAVVVVPVVVAVKMSVASEGEVTRFAPAADCPYSGSAAVEEPRASLTEAAVTGSVV